MALPNDVETTDTFFQFRNKFNETKNNTLDKNLNLSDVPDPAAARSNLGVQEFIDDTTLAMALILS